MHTKKSWLRPALLAGMIAAVAAHETRAFAQPAAEAQPSPAAVQNATRAFLLGLRLFEEQKFDQALAQFELSYATVPSPNSHLYIARCLLGQGQPRKAYLELDKVLAAAEARAATDPKYAPTRDTARLERDELAAALAFVTVHVKGGAGGRLTIGGVEVPPDQWGREVVINPGPVDVVLDKPGAEPVRHSVTVEPGEHRQVQLGMVAPSPEREPTRDRPAPPVNHSNAGTLRPVSFVAAGVGVAGLATFAVAGLMSKSTYSDLEETCAGPCPPDRADDISAGKTQQTIANVGLVVGAVGAAASVALFVLSTTSDPVARRREAKGAFVVVAPGYAGCSGRF